MGRKQTTKTGRARGSLKEDGGTDHSNQAGSQPVRHPQQRVGNRAIQTLHERGQLQASLEVSSPRDPAEREAKRVADTVLDANGPGPDGADPEPKPRIQRAATERAGGTSLGDATTDRVQSALTGGRPLAPRTRTTFESRFGRDFSDVRIHTDTAADAAARAIDAQAFTLGSHIVFSSGAFGTETSRGRRLLAHELTHVVQADNDAVRRQQNYRQLGDRDNNVSTRGTTREISLIHRETFVRVLAETGDPDEAFDRSSAVLYDYGQQDMTTVETRRGVEPDLVLDVGPGPDSAVLAAAEEEGWMQASEVIEPLLEEARQRAAETEAREQAMGGVGEAVNQASVAADQWLEEWIETARELDETGEPLARDGNHPFTPGGREFVRTMVHLDTFYQVWEETKDPAEAMERAAAHLLANEGGSYEIQPRTPAGFEFRDRDDYLVEDQAFYRSEAQAIRKTRETGWLPLSELEAIRPEDDELASEEEQAHPEEASQLELTYEYMLSLEHEGTIPPGTADRFLADWRVALAYDGPLDQLTYLYESGWVDEDRYLAYVDELIREPVAKVEFLYENGWIDESQYERALAQVRSSGAQLAYQSDEQLRALERQMQALDLEYMMGSGRVVTGHQLPAARAYEDLQELGQIGLASNPGAALGYIMSHLYCDDEQERRNIARRHGALFDAVTAFGRSRRGPGTNTAGLNRGFGEHIRDPVRVDTSGYQSRAGHSHRDVSRPSHTSDRYSRMAQEYGVGNYSPPTR